MRKQMSMSIRSARTHSLGANAFARREPIRSARTHSPGANAFARRERIRFTVKVYKENNCDFSIINAISR